jgi:sigma-B regulation protein RsbU (phosphoserine phosphatase)
MTAHHIDIRPATESAACGDFAEYVVLDSFRSALFVGDAAGHGPAASAAARGLQACVRSTLLKETSLSHALQAIDGLFVRNQQNESVPFATLFVAIQDRREGGLLRYASAGHEPALVFDDAGHHRHLAPTGPPLGLQPLLGAPINERSVTLGQGDFLVIVTDGITEARHSDCGTLKLFGSTGIVRAVREARLSARSIAKTIHQAAFDHARGAQCDDACVTVLMYPGRHDDTESSRSPRELAGRARQLRLRARHRPALFTRL